MSDTIFREEVKNAINATIAESIECEHSAIEALNLLCHEIMALPSAEKKGKWIFIGEYTCIDGFMNRVWKCNQCGWKVVDDSNYCPNCGARMEE